MSLSANYPVTVNGFTCRNCTDVDLAKRHIDPAHPNLGPYGIDAPTARGSAVKLGGQLAALTAPAFTPATPGGRVNITA